MNLRAIKRSLRLLTPEQLVRLDTWLHELINGEEFHQELAKEKHGGIGESRTMSKTYRLESVRCGKKKCRCASGELHGPY